MKFAKSILTAASVLALAAGGAIAADKQAKNDPEPGFNNLDANNDGKLSRAEAAKDKSLAAKFKEADRDNDGTLSRAEYLIVKGKKDIGRAADAVKDAVTDDEKQAAAAGAGASAGASTTARSRSPQDAEPGFNTMDANNDGKLTRAEAGKDKSLLSKWKEADMDNDGTLSRAEYLRIKGKKDIGRAADAVKDAVTDDEKRAAAGGTAK